MYRAARRHSREGRQSSAKRKVNIGLIDSSKSLQECADGYCYAGLEVTSGNAWIEAEVTLRNSECKNERLAPGEEG
jgi:hypothetical protein